MKIDTSVLANLALKLISDELERYLGRNIPP